jgi:C4-dicarboxylate-specific signal transduction histidine kinase
VFLEISDNGPGISKKHSNKIFEPFFTTKPAGEGMGLGLSIVHSIVTSYGGQIQVKSNKPTGGATFRVEFPAADKQRGEYRA